MHKKSPPFERALQAGRCYKHDMTMILSYITHTHAIQVSDRRVSILDKGKYTVRDDTSNKAVVYCGSSSQGQGHETTFAQIVAGRLGIPIENVEVVHGDTGRIPFGMGTYGSRSLAVGGTAIVKALESDHAPLHLVLGRIALETVRTKMEKLRGELDASVPDAAIPRGVSEGEQGGPVSEPTIDEAGHAEDEAEQLPIRVERACDHTAESLREREDDGGDDTAEALAPDLVLQLHALLVFRRAVDAAEHDAIEVGWVVVARHDGRGGGATIRHEGGGFAGIGIPN